MTQWCSPPRNTLDRDSQSVLLQLRERPCGERQAMPTPLHSDSDTLEKYVAPPESAVAMWLQGEMSTDRRAISAPCVDAGSVRAISAPWSPAHELVADSGTCFGFDHQPVIVQSSATPDRRRILAAFLKVPQTCANLDRFVFPQLPTLLVHSRIRLRYGP